MTKNCGQITVISWRATVSE